MALIESCLTILGATSGLATMHAWFTGFKIGDQVQQTLNEQEIIRSEIQRLSDHILYVPSIQQVHSLNETSQKLSELRSLREILEPMQNSLKEDILSTAVLTTPSKLKEAFQRDPWEVLIEIRPAARTRIPSNPDLVPILFTDAGYAYIGWQTKGTLPLLFGCDYSANLNSNVSRKEINQIITDDSNNRQKILKSKSQRSFLKNIKSYLIGTNTKTRKIQKRLSLRKMEIAQPSKKLPEKIMIKWRCNICGYIHIDKNPPFQCPVCGSSKEKTMIIKWKCNVCAYIHKADKPPDQCPVCGTPKKNFMEVVEDVFTQNTEFKWQCAVCNYVHKAVEPPDICPVCGANKNKFVFNDS